LAVGQTVIAEGGMAVIQGTNGSDTLFGTASGDTIYGKDGDDYEYGGAGNDSLHGDKGNDVLDGEAGSDNLYGKDGDDALYGAGGNDNLYGDAGTDWVFGEAGNDVVKGGTGISYLFGDDGNDQLFYNPTKSSIPSIGNYLESSWLEGGAGNDTLNIFNEATYQFNGKTEKSLTTVAVDDYGVGHIAFAAQQSQPGAVSDIPVGSFFGNEAITVTGKGLYFNGNLWGDYDTKITGTQSADEFHSYYAHDTMIGGGGNDKFYFGGGDTVTSSNSDADEMHFADWLGGTATVTGFSGGGSAAGDKLYLYGDATVSEAGGKTTFSLIGTSDSVVVDETGMDLNVDYFIV
jgi:Ca2+-binding RTX toxin-like protein